MRNYLRNSLLITESRTDFPVLAKRWGRVQAQQLQMVAAGERAACRLRVHRENLPDMVKVAHSLSIKMVVGFDAIATKSVAGRCGFSEWGRRYPLGPHQLADSYVYFCVDHIYGQKLRRADESGDDLAVGELLGYPPCCVSAFGNRWQHECESDPVLLSYGDALQIDWRLNVSLLCFDYALLSHVPCAPDCQQSLKMAAHYYDFISELCPPLASDLERKLRTWVLHTDSLGIAAFTTPESAGLLTVDDILAVDPQSVLGQLMDRGTLVECNDGAVIIDGAIFTGSGIKLYNFI
jgi:hypothetical protein